MVDRIFVPLPGLTGLVTHSGQLPLSGDDGQGRFNPGDRFSEAGSRYHGGVMSRIANIGFDRANPFRAIVVTPSAVVYYGDLSLTGIDRILGLKCKEPTWLACKGPVRIGVIHQRACCWMERLTWDRRATVFSK